MALIVVRTTTQIKEALKDFPGAVPCPIAEIIPQSITISPVVQAIILTSVNAVPAAKNLNLPVYAVGENTAAAAKKVGLKVIITGKKDAINLAKQIVAATLGQTHLVFAHLHGDTANLNWHKILIDAGLKITPQQAYAVKWIKKITTQLKNEIAKPEPHIFLIFSKKSAEHLQKLVRPLPEYTAICISPQVAVACRGFGKVMVADSPTRANMAKAVKTAVEGY